MKIEKRLSERRRRRSGVSSTEFALTFFLMLPVITGVLFISFNHAFSSYFRYATFMAARAYLSGGPNETDQQARAEASFKGYVASDLNTPFAQVVVPQGSNSSVPGLAIRNTAPTGGGGANPPWKRGVEYHFAVRFFPSFMGLGNLGKIETFTAESFLGRDPTMAECLDTMDGTLPAATGGVDPFLFDNGC